MWSDFTLSPSFKVKQGQSNLKGFITRLLLILEVCNVKPTCRILWAGNLLMSDLTFGPSFKVKRWFTGFGELSFRWIQICIGFPMRRSSLLVLLRTYNYKNRLQTINIYVCINLHFPSLSVLLMSASNCIKILQNCYYIPRRKSGIYWIQVRRAAAAVEISLWTR